MSLFIGSAPRLAERHRLRCRLPSRHHAHDALLAPNSSPGVGRISFLRVWSLCPVSLRGRCARGSRASLTSHGGRHAAEMLSSASSSRGNGSGNTPLHHACFNCPCRNFASLNAPLSQHTPVATKSRRSIL